MIAKIVTEPANKTVANGKPADPNLTTQLPLRDMVWMALEKIAARQKDPDQLTAGARHVLDMQLSGRIDGRPFRQDIDAIITVGHPQTRSSSVNPQVSELLAFILGKLNHNTRTRILTDIPGEFEANDCRIPVTDASLVEAARRLLKQLRRVRSVQTRCPVRCQFVFPNRSAAMFP